MGTYDVKAGEEATWAGVCAAAGVLLGTILTAVGVEQNITVAAVSFVVVATRFLGGIFVNRLGGSDPVP